MKDVGGIDIGEDRKKKKNLKFFWIIFILLRLSYLIKVALEIHPLIDSFFQYINFIIPFMDRKEMPLGKSYEVKK